MGEKGERLLVGFAKVRSTSSKTTAQPFNRHNTDTDTVIGQMGLELNAVTTGAEKMEKTLALEGIVEFAERARQVFDA